MVEFGPDGGHRSKRQAPRNWSFGGEDLGINRNDDEDLYQEDSLEFEAGWGNAVVVDNLPVVPLEEI